MKAVTLWEPWATLVAVGAKQFETRSWKTSHRGELAIHASVRRDVLKRLLSDEPLGEDAEPLRAILKRLGLSKQGQFGFGCVVAIVDLVGVMSTTNANPTVDEEAVGDWRPGRFAWQLRNVRRQDPPIEARGAQLLWEWTPPSTDLSQEAPTDDGGLFRGF